MGGRGVAALEVIIHSSICKLIKGKDHYYIAFLLQQYSTTYSSLKIIQNIFKRLPIASPWGQGMGCILWVWSLAGIILCMHTANERWHYTVTPSLIGWARTQNDLWSGLPLFLTHMSCNTNYCVIITGISSLKRFYFDLYNIDINFKLKKTTRDWNKLRKIILLL